MYCYCAHKLVNFSKKDKNIGAKMQKTTNLNVRIEPDVKEKAEGILSSLGISVSSAINMFFKQIILQNGIPFELKIKPNPPISTKELTEKDFKNEIEKGFLEAEKIDTITASDAFADIRKKFGL